MKGRVLILIFLFVALLLNPATCESGNGTFTGYVSVENDYTIAHGGGNEHTDDFRLELNHDVAGIPDIYTIENIHARNNSNYSHTPCSVGDPFYIYYSVDGTTKTELIGYGSVRVYKKSDAGTIDGYNAFNIDLIFYFDNININTSLTGLQYYILDGAWITTYSHYHNLYWQAYGPGKTDVYNNIYGVITNPTGSLIGKGAHGAGIKHEFKTLSNFRNDYEYEITSSFFDVDIQRIGFIEDYNKASKIKIVNYTDDTIYYQSAYSSINTSHFLGIGDYNYYIVRQIDDYEHLIYTYSEGEGEDEGENHTAVIEFNQTYYTDPEDIEMEWDITAFDSGSYTYEIQVITSVSGEFSQDSWPADGNWNVSPFISSASGAAVFDFYSDGYDLPIWIQGELWAQEKSSGTWTKLDNTPAVVYHEAALGPGQIWTDKSNYNVTELVEIWYTTNVAENYIAVEEPHSLWSTHDVPVGTYSFLYELSTSAVGNTTIYLFENSELVDQVIISVSSESGDDAYAAWMKDYYFEGETASFYYYSSNASAQITVYDGADIVVFGPATTQLGYHNGRVNTANTNPGTFLLSLYHNGTYYNDTMIFESVDSWVRFDSSKYNVGDTINIEYYLADPTHQISMWDAHVGLVIRFTTNYGVLVSGSMETVPFTLSEDNEYSYDVPGKLSSGDLTLGYWTVFIEERNGVLGDSWDEAYVCYATDDGSYGTDASNEMISIFFSPEGTFMLYTVCLTMMGLVLAKHPAGGGAGATVGVGFGTYFNVLPVWMLMLTVILLVVMAGVSIAVYYKGK